MAKQRLGTADTGRVETESSNIVEKPAGQQPKVVETLDCTGSTLLSNATYNYQTHELVATFRSTSQSYRFTDVPSDVWERVCISPSKGAAFIRLVRNGGYGSTIVD